MSGSRYASVKLLDYCFHPKKILKDGEYIFVPCGKCDGCLLHHANQWSQRVSQEIEYNPFSIFFTLTYNNHYLPTLVPFKTSFGDYMFISDHRDNVRFNGHFDVLRDDHIVMYAKSFIPISNDSRLFTINYASKKDIQLWLKLLRKDISVNLNYGKEAFRYYVISEIGPTTHRAHFHGILFPRSQEIAEYLLSTSMYSNWSMCDRFLFFQHTSYCDSGTATYVSNYTTSNSQLPSVYQDPSIKPFRLSSRSPGIGFRAFDKEEIFEKIIDRNLTFTRTISKVDQTYLLGYPTAYLSRLFPKCYRYRFLSFERLLWIYGTLYREVRGFGRPYIYVLQRLRKSLHASDFEAMIKCFQFCKDHGCPPFHYVFLLDRLWYLQSMKSLASWYQWQEDNCVFPAKLLASYNNLSDYVTKKHSLSSYQWKVIDTFCEQFGICFDDLSVDSLIFHDASYDSYVQQVSDIVSRLDKSKKVNEFIKQNPHEL